MRDNYTKYMRLYQRQGVERLKMFGGKAIHADEMGLGKTLQILAYIYETRKDNIPCLIVCPASLTYNWKAEIKQWLDCDSVFMAETRYGAAELIDEALKHEFIIISYDLLIYWVDELIRYHDIKIAVFDEAHLLKESRKNPTKEMKTVAGYRIQGNERVTAADMLCWCYPRKIFATGTPVCNNPLDLMNFLSWIDPANFWITWDFEDKYIMKDKTVNMAGKNLKALNKLLRDNYMIRRRKIDVLKELPEKVRVSVPVQASKDCLLEYNICQGLDQRMEMRKALTPTLVKNGIDFIESYIAGGKKIVVFAVFHETIDELAKYFGDKAVVYDGRMSASEKWFAEKKFQHSDNVKVFIGNVQAAGKGITLTAADATLTLEYTDSAADMLQAEDRIYRIGQKSSAVTCYYMHCAGTIDEEIVDNLNSKIKQITQAVDGYEATESDLFPKDVVYLPQPPIDWGEVFKRAVGDFLLYSLAVAFMPLVLLFGFHRKWERKG